MMLGVFGVLSFVVAFVAVRVLLSQFARLALDHPNARSLHERPVPRTGGIAVLLGAAVSLGLGDLQLWLPMLIALCLAVVSFLDDLRHMPTAARLGFHFAGAGLLCWYFLSPIYIVEMLVLILAVVWITNLYNFMDGADGIAGGMALIGFGAYGLAAYSTGHHALAALCIAIAAAAAAFLATSGHCGFRSSFLGRSSPMRPSRCSSA
jgi:UDP-GlcNAc:undecaprenyl-phosphate GlcNAc-1-phosphate transferase